MSPKKKVKKENKIWTAVQNSAPFKAWMRFAHVLGRINTTILMTLFYVFFIGIAKIGALIGRSDPLDSKWKDKESFWRKRNDFAVTKENLRKPY